MNVTDDELEYALHLLNQVNKTDTLSSSPSIRVFPPVFRPWPIFAGCYISESEPTHIYVQIILIPINHLHVLIDIILVVLNALALIFCLFLILNLLKRIRVAIARVSTAKVKIKTYILSGSSEPSTTRLRTLSLAVSKCAILFPNLHIPGDCSLW
jgi:hypothetical protein